MTLGDLIIMVRLSLRALCTLSAVLALTASLQAERKLAYELLPPNTEAVVWIPNSAELSNGWGRTQLSKLSQDPAIKPFFEEQRQAIENRLIEAGWKLNIRPRDIAEYVDGQVAIAFLSKSDSPRKPYSLALLADVQDDSKLNRELLENIDSQLRERDASKAELSHEGIEIFKYSLPKSPGQLLAETSFFAICEGQFLATDDEALIADFIDRISSGSSIPSETLAQEPAFLAARARLEMSGDSQIEYFVRPIGFAKTLRAIAGKRSKSSTDILAVLENQGFAAIEAVSGEIFFGEPLLDMRHQGVVVAEKPLPKSASILDFPNEASPDIPAFVKGDVSSFLALNWDADEAFWKAEGLVDEIVGTEGVFDKVIEGIRDDVNGPRIDIANDVLPQLTDDIFAITDSREGETSIDSRRNLIALRIKDTETMRRVIDRAMRNEPDAELLDFEGRSIWQVVNRDDEEVVDLSSDFGEFGAPVGGEQQTNNQDPWLSNWAITVDGGYLMFASHADMIKEAIVQIDAGTPSPLLEKADYQRLSNALGTFFNTEEISAWQMVRNRLAYRVQYELFRQGKLRESQSMLASLLDRLLDEDAEIRETSQKVSGKSLPAFEKIQPFLQPGGLVVTSTEDGWVFGGLLLSDKDVPQHNAEPTDASSVGGRGTARISNSSEEDKR